MKAGTVKAWLFATSVLSAAAGVISLALLLMVPMLFDSPGSTEQPATVLFALSIATFPLSCLLGIVASWLLYRRGHLRAALVLALAPVVPLLAAALAFAAIMLFQDGRLGG